MLLRKADPPLWRHRKDPPRRRGRDGQGLQRLDADGQERPRRSGGLLRRRCQHCQERREQHREREEEGQAARRLHGSHEGAVLPRLPQDARRRQEAQHPGAHRLHLRPHARPHRHPRDEDGHPRLCAEAPRAHPLGGRVLRQDGQGVRRGHPDGQPGLGRQRLPPQRGDPPERHPRRREGSARVDEPSRVAAGPQRREVRHQPHDGRRDSEVPQLGHLAGHRQGASVPRHVSRRHRRL